MNECISKMLTRHAIRRFQNRQLDREALEQILQAGLYAPSAGNNQYSRIVVCQDRQVNDKLGRINRYMQFKGNDPKSVAHAVSAEQPSIQDDFSILSGYYNAPTVLTIFTKNHKYAYEDAAMIGENLMLAAHFLDIGACYVGRTEEVFATEYGMEMRKQWGIPEDMVAVCNVLLGYREGPAPHDKPRKDWRIVWALCPQHTQEENDESDTAAGISDPAASCGAGIPQSKNPPKHFGAEAAAESSDECSVSRTH